MASMRRSSWWASVAIVLLVGLSAIVLAGCSANYAKEVKNSLKRVVDEDLFSAYVFRGSPVGTFGVGTMYLKDAESSDNPESSWLIGYPGSWFVDLDEAERDELLTEIIILGPMGSLNLQEEISRKLGINVAVPQLSDIISADANLNYEKGVKVTMRASRMVNRKLNWLPFREAVDAGKAGEGIRQHVEVRDYIMAAADIVLEGYEATVVVNVGANAQLNAALNEAVGEQTKAGLKFNISATQDGTFNVSAAEPVVVALLFKEPPRGGPLGTSDILTWPAVDIDSDRLTLLDSLAVVTGGP